MKADLVSPLSWLEGISKSDSRKTSNPILIDLTVESFFSSAIFASTSFLVLPLRSINSIEPSALDT